MSRHTEEQPRDHDCRYTTLSQTKRRLRLQILKALRESLSKSVHQIDPCIATIVQMAWEAQRRRALALRVQVFKSLLSFTASSCALKNTQFYAISIETWEASSLGIVLHSPECNENLLYSHHKQWCRRLFNSLDTCTMQCSSVVRPFNNWKTKQVLA